MRFIHRSGGADSPLRLTVDRQGDNSADIMGAAKAASLSPSTTIRSGSIALSPLLDAGGHAQADCATRSTSSVNETSPRGGRNRPHLIWLMPSAAARSSRVGATVDEMSFADCIRSSTSPHWYVPVHHASVPSCTAAQRQDRQTRLARRPWAQRVKQQPPRRSQGGIIAFPKTFRTSSDVRREHQRYRADRHLTERLGRIGTAAVRCAAAGIDKTRAPVRRGALSGESDLFLASSDADSSRRHIDVPPGRLSYGTFVLCARLLSGGLDLKPVAPDCARPDTRSTRPSLDGCAERAAGPRR